MRAGPLSDDKVIETLNRYYVPAYTSIEDYAENGSADAEDKQAYTQIYHSALKANMSCGSVSGYVLAPDGTVLESAVVSTLGTGDYLLNMLQVHAKKLRTRPGKPVVEPKRQSAPPAADSGSLVLHLVARAEGTGPSGGSWREFPGENWVVFDPNEAIRLLPDGDVSIGKAWDLDQATSAKLLIYFYPQSEDPYDKPDCKIESQSLKAKVISIRNGIATARIDGSLRMQHNFYPGRAGDYVDAKIVGYLEFHVNRRQVQSLKLVTDGATFGTTKFDVVVNSQTPEVP